MRRSSAFVSLVLLAFVLVLGATPIDAKPSGTADIKACRGNGYLTIARSLSPTTPFASVAECVRFVTGGGTTTPLVPVLTLTWFAVEVEDTKFGGMLTGSGLMPGAEVVYSSHRLDYSTEGPEAVFEVEPDGTVDRFVGPAGCEFYESITFATSDYSGETIKVTAEAPC